MELKATQVSGEDHFLGAVSCAGSGRLQCSMTLQAWCPLSPALGSTTSCHQCFSGLGSRRHLGLRGPRPHALLFLNPSSLTLSSGDEKASSGSQCGQEDWLLDPALPSGQQVLRQVTIPRMEIWEGLETVEWRPLYCIMGVRGH